MNYHEAQEYYIGRQVALKDWHHIITKPGTRGKITSIVKTNQGEFYVSVKLQDDTDSEEQFELTAFHNTFRVVDH